MKQSIFRLLLLSIVFLLGSKQAQACHGVALVNFSASVNANSVTVNGSSDAATCGCGPYYMEVEIVCFSAANFTGNAPSCNAATWNIYPWYRAILNVPNYTAANNWPDNCSVEPYNSVVIPFTDLCPGTQYVLRARERVCGSGSGGPWSSNYTFTTPGVAPVFSINASANPTTVCSGNPSTLTAVINGVGGCGSGNPVFTWMPGNLIGSTVTVHPTATTVYTVTATGGYLACYPVPPATVTVTVLPPPVAGTASVSPPVVCQGGCVTLTLTGSVGNIQWESSPNSTTWTPIPGATTTPYVYCPVNAAMYFHAVVGSAGCGTVTSNVVSVGITPVPTLTVTPVAPSICAGQSVTLNVSGGSGYTWTGPNNYSAPGSSVTVSPTTTTTYTVTTTGLCPAVDSVTVIVNPLPVIVFTPPAPSICAGTSVTIDAGSDTNSYVWSPSVGITPLSASNDSVSASPAATTNYVVTSTSPAGCMTTDSVTVTINPIPVLVLSDTALTLCPNMSDTVTVSGANTYVWNPMLGANLLTGNGSQVEFNPASSTTYTVVGTSAAGCADSAVVSVTVSNQLVVDAGLPDSICPGASTILSGTGGTSYQWSCNNMAFITNGNTANPTVTPTVTTTFTVNVSNAAGCTGLDSVVVLVRNLPTPNAGIDTALCPGGSISLNGSGGNTYNWTGNNITSGSTTATPTVAPSATGNYILTVTDGYGCQNSDTVNVMVRALPNANAGADQNICGNNCANLLANGGTNYAWTPAATLSSPNTAATQACPQMTTTYVVQVTDVYGCVNTDTVKVIVDPPLTVAASANASICTGGNTTISANGNGGDGGPYNYAWSPTTGLATPNAQSSVATPTVTTTYTITLTDNCGSIAVIDSVTVTVFPIPQLQVTPSITSGCAPVCVDFTGISQPAAASCNYDFGDNSTSTNCNPTHCFMNAGSYTIVYTVTDMNGCSNTITYPNMITVHPNPVAGFTLSPQNTTIIAPDITVTPNCTSCDTTHYWMGGPSDPEVTNLVQPFVFSYNDTGSYQIVQVVTNQFGCSDTAYDQVYIAPDWSFFAPNAFTPNDDNHNDIFYVYGEGIDNSKFEMWIFDRWGNLIFVSDDINKGWNGYANAGSKLAQIDTYVWRVKFNDIKGDSHTYLGRVSLIR